MYRVFVRVKKQVKFKAALQKMEDLSIAAVSSSNSSRSSMTGGSKFNFEDYDEFSYDSSSCDQSESGLEKSIVTQFFNGLNERNVMKAEE